MAPRKPWQPKVEVESELNPFVNRTAERDGLLDTPEVSDPEEDSSPLEGSKDLSDEDSLVDVIADSTDRGRR
jgi:hypothetical protein